MTLILDDVMDVRQRAAIDWLYERAPHVSAWCYRADGLLLPDGIHPQDCAPSCHDHRILTATKFYDAGIRPPIKVVTSLKKPARQKPRIPINSKHPAGSKIPVLARPEKTSPGASPAG